MGIVLSVLAAMVAVLIGLTQAADARTRALIAGVSAGYPTLNEAGASITGIATDPVSG